MAFDEQNFDIVLSQAEKLRSSDRQAFITLLEEIESDFEQLSIDQRYFFLYLTGYKHTYEGDIAKGIKTYKHVFENSQNKSLKHRAAISLINIYALTRDWNLGFQYLDYVNEIGIRINEVNLRHDGWIASAIFYNEVELYDLALFNVKRLKSEEIKGRNLCFSNAIEIKAFISQKQLGVEDNFIEESIAHCRSEKENIVADVITYYFAQKLINKKNYKKAKSLLLNNLLKTEKTKFKFSILGTQSLISRAALELNEYQLAQEYAYKVISANSGISVINPVVEAKKVLYEIALSRRDFRGALNRLVALQESEKIRFDDIKAKQFSIESAKHAALEKDNQIKLLNKQNQILQLEKALSKETATYNRWFIILLVVIVSILILWVYYVKRAQQRLKYLAEFDSLTGTCNRAYFTQNADTILSYFSKSSRTASLVLFDLDHFKKINDTYGHLAGDEVLTQVTNVCKECVRKVDVLGRVGGEEFAILLPGCEQEQASKIADDCRIKISQLNSFESHSEISVSASFGVADTISSGYLLKDLIANADEAMYLAKRRGRNQVVKHKSV